MKTRNPFFAPLQPLENAVRVVVETASKKITDAIFVAGLATRSASRGYTMIDIGDGSFAFFNTTNESERFPLSGGLSLNQAEQFVLARERESIW